MARYVGAAVESCLGQTSQDWELLVLDDGSTDSTWLLLQEWAGDSRIRLFRHEKCQGLSASRNELLKKARGRWLSILDADDLLFQTKMADHAKVLESRADIGVVWGSSVLLSNGEFTILPKAEFRPGWDVITPYQAAHSATTWRKEAVTGAGGYDPSRVLVEAPDLFLKVGDRYRQEYCPRLAALKRVDSNNSFRKQLTPDRRDALSHRLIEETLQRRYGVSAGCLRAASSFI